MSLSGWISRVDGMPWDAFQDDGLQTRLTATLQRPRRGTPGAACECRSVWGGAEAVT